MTRTLASFMDHLQQLVPAEEAVEIDFDSDDFERRLAKMLGLLDAFDVLLSQHVDDSDQSHFQALFAVRQELLSIIERADQELRTPLRISQNAPLAFPPFDSETPIMDDSSSSSTSSSSTSSSSTSSSSTSSSSTSSSTSSSSSSSLIAVPSETIPEEKGPEPLTRQEEGECGICWESGEVYVLPCTHAYCLECLRGHLGAKIDEAQVAAISCPTPQCAFAFEYNDVQQLVTPEQMERFVNFSMLSFLKTDPLSKFCPYDGCSAYMMLPDGADEGGNDGEAARMQCPSCNQDVCPKCGGKEHRFGQEATSCSQNASAAKAEVAAQLDSRTRRRLRHMGVQECPQCGMAIVRTTGCPDMTCSGCKASFKWKGDSDETTLEKVTFFYPRIVKYIATSNEAHSQGPVTQVLAGGLVALVLLPAAIPTLILGIPAGIIWSGRKIKHGISHASQDIREIRQERRQAHQERRRARADRTAQPSSSSPSSSSSSSPAPSNTSTSSEIR